MSLHPPCARSCARHGRTDAGYAVGNRLVDAYLAATGRTAAEALLVDRRDVIDTALRTRGASTGS
ncbi:hypothetical protein [Amycolatopsis japonica]|uniref:hypothetical protein n=1 Tax=Amycolatopsis japonica TaxID=208439 RepID=UPI00382B548A